MKQKEKQKYEKPTSKVIKLEAESFICTSVTLDAQSSQENQWPGWTEEQHNGGSIGFGDENTIAPAKHSVWEEEE
jgi:hypothetical protein